MPTVVRFLIVILTVSLSSLSDAKETGNPLPYSNVTVFEAAKIITMEPGFPEAKFVATADGIILGLGQSMDDLEAWTRGREVTIDRRFASNILMPGFVEPHIHPMQAIMMLPLPFISPEAWELPGKSYPAARGKADYEKRLKEELAKSGEKLFITWGHHRLFHGEMNRTELDRIAPDRPVVIWQRSFHEIIVNSKALELLEIGNQASFNTYFDKPQITPGHADFASGIIHETALFGGIEKLRPYLFSPKKMQQGLADMRQMMLENGVTTSADLAFGGFGGPDMESKIFKSLYDQPTTPSRILAIPIAPVVGDDPDAWLSDIQAKFQSDKFFFSNRVKLLADGAFFAQYMQMNPPGYSDGHEGKWITEPKEVEKFTQKFWDAGWNIHTHVNGDKGLDVVLGISEKLPPRHGQKLIMEHLGYSTEAQNRRIADMGIMVSAQPNYIRILGDKYAETGLGPDRAAQMNRLGSLERKNVPLGLHSDFNMAPIDPLYLAWVATNRETLDDNVKAPAEKLSLDKALRAITIEAAQVIGLDAMVGSIATGKKADFTVLGANPYDIGAKNLRNIQVQGVIFEGQYHSAQ